MVWHIEQAAIADHSDHPRHALPPPRRPAGSHRSSVRERPRGTTHVRLAARMRLRRNARGG
ncbi:hypothetical protein RR46_05992 [Papilio xuthus]|uniref:Uncharacterized protein n=1 Tax=Papilio xuthus TaxID=66420 RepID=A0A194QE07_PAPXU|nr:hypothetical protein RR46_05992 [Papilio xuthus]